MKKLLIVLILTAGLVGMGVFGVIGKASIMTKHMEEGNKTINESKRPNFTAELNKSMNRAQERRAEMFLHIQLNVINRIENVLNKAENITLPTEYESEYNAHIKKAREYLENAKILLNETSDKTPEEIINITRAARTEIRASIFELREAAKVIKKVLAKFEKGIIVLQNEKLHASGDGLVALSGNFNVSGDVGAGNVRLLDTAGDMNPKVLNASTTVELPNGAILYSGVRGHIEVNGSSFSMAVSGNNISIYIEGTGSVILRGNGTYTNAESGVWYRCIES